MLTRLKHDLTMAEAHNRLVGGSSPPGPTT
jgi:hypothetical protein